MQRHFLAYFLFLFSLMGFSRDIFKSAFPCVAAAIAVLSAPLPWLTRRACARILLVNKPLSALLGSVFP